MGPTAQPRLLIVAGHPDSLVRFRGDLIRRLLALGVCVHAAAPDLLAHSPAALKLSSWGAVAHPIWLKRTGLNPLHDVRTLIELYQLIRVVRPTHLLAYTAKPVIYGLLAARASGLPEATGLITGLGYAFTSECATWKRRAVQSLLRVLYRGALRGARRVVFQNSDDRALFIQLGLARPGQCALVDGSGVNLAEYPATSMPPPVPCVRFLLIARLIRDKGILEFVDAGRQLKERYPNLELHLVGGLDSNPAAISSGELERWVADGSVVYHGQLADVRPIIAWCHVFVLPSAYREGVPRTILEAMAMARPIITCDAPGCRDTVREGENGYLVPMRDVSALAAAMERFLQEPGRIGGMGQASRMLAVKKYDVNHVNQQMLEHMGLAAASASAS